MASTAIKLADGISAEDATALARDMRCEPEFLHGMRKRRNPIEFACFIRNATPRPLRLAVPFGRMERRPRLTEDERRELLARNRARFCAGIDELLTPVGVKARRTTGRFATSEQEVL